MFDKAWIGYPGPSLFDYLWVFAALFFAGSAWTMCFNWYIDFLLGRKEKAHE